MKKNYNNWGFNSEKEMFLQIVETRELKSWLSGEKLPSIHSSFFINVFAHVLEKAQGKYPKFKLNPDNVILITPKEHDLIHNGSKEQKESYAKLKGFSWDKFDELVINLKEQYKKFEKNNP